MPFCIEQCTIVIIDANILLYAMSLINSSA